MAPGQATFPGRADTPRSPASRATKRSRLRARCCYRCLHSGQLGVAALRPAERPRRPPRRPGWVLHTVQFSIPLRLYRITRVAHTDPRTSVVLAHSDLTPLTPVMACATSA